MARIGTHDGWPAVHWSPRHAARTFASGPAQNQGANGASSGGQNPPDDTNAPAPVSSCSDFCDPCSFGGVDGAMGQACLDEMYCLSVGASYVGPGPSSAYWCRFPPEAGPDAATPDGGPLGAAPVDVEGGPSDAALIDPEPADAGAE